MLLGPHAELPECLRYSRWVIAGLLRRAWKSFGPKERPRPMSTKEAEARLVPDSHGVEVLDGGVGKLTDPEGDGEEPSS